MSAAVEIFQFNRNSTMHKARKISLRQHCWDWEETSIRNSQEIRSFPRWIYLTDLKVSWHVNMLGKHVTTLESFAPKQIRDKFHHAWVKVRSKASGKVFTFTPNESLSKVQRIEYSLDEWTVWVWNWKRFAYVEENFKKRGSRKLAYSWTSTLWIISSSSVRSQVLNASLPNFSCGKTLSCTFLHE